MRSGLQAMGEGRFPEARSALESASQSAPSNPQVCLALTQLYARIKEEKPRIASSDRCVALAHRSPGWETKSTVRNYLGKLYLANAEFARAISEYREAVRINPYEESYRFDLAQALLNHEMFAEAAEVLEDAVKVFDRSAQLQLALGVAYYGQRRFPEAVNAFLRTIELAPDIAQPYVFLGRMIDQAGDKLPEVTRRFQEFQQAFPTNYLGSLLSAKAIAAASGDPKQEEALLRHSIELKSDSWESHYELGVVLEARHDFTSASQELQRSAELNPGISATHYHLARVYDRLDKPDAAARERELHLQLTSRDKVTAGMEVSR